MEKEYIIAHADKTVLKISGVQVRGLDTRQLEAALTERLESVVRVIGVTGSSIDMDVYGVSAEDILKDEKGIISAISLSQGIQAEEIAQIASAKKIVEVDYSDMPKMPKTACARERWMDISCKEQ